MNKTQAATRAGELLGLMYWHERGTFLINNYDEVSAEWEQLKQDLNADIFPDETNNLGNTIERGFIENGDRYRYDFDECTPAKGWAQYDTDQDAWYFGVWVHVGDRKVLTYAEGDTTLVTCPTLEQFQAELESMSEFYGDPPPAAIAFTQEGTRIEYYDERPTA